MQWSDDGRALAVVDDRAGVWSHPWYFRLILWRDGRRVRMLDRLQPLMRFEAVMGMRWSPDNERLLIRGALSQGEADIGFTDLWCLDVPSGCARLLDHTVTRAEWLDRNQVRYWTGEVRRTAEDPNGADVVESLHERDCRRGIAPDPSEGHDSPWGETAEGRRRGPGRRKWGRARRRARRTQPQPVARLREEGKAGDASRTGH